MTVAGTGWRIASALWSEPFVDIALLSLPPGTGKSAGLTSTGHLFVKCIAQLPQVLFCNGKAVVNRDVTDGQPFPWFTSLSRFNPVATVPARSSVSDPPASSPT
jgi:hypothetical protein